MNESIVAIIPVKKNSSRLPNKNILPFADSNLLEYKIKQLKRVDRIKEIIVSSDSEEMLEIAKKNNVSIDRRPIDLANETKPFSDFLIYLTSIISKKHTHLMWACCTSPLVDIERYNEAITIYLEKLKEGKNDSLITVYNFKHFLLDDQGPMNFEVGPAHVNSQDLPSFDLFTNGIILSQISSVKKWKYHFGPNPYRLYLKQVESIDIDTKFDYECALCAYRSLNDDTK